MSTIEVIPTTATGPDVAIAISNVSKLFKLYHDVITGPVKELVFYWRRKDFYRTFPAVCNVSFSVRRGEVVGIIGPNGAGKTTLLKMIAGLLPVDSGNIATRGRVTALLALGVGVHPEFTGRENIYYGGLLLGMSKSEIVAKTPSIIEFSELGEFIDRPLRTYSSGMRARLLFSISMSIDPDILIVDEALATGDAYFVAKCGQRIRELCRSGATILFVSHNLAQVQEICGRALFMAEGRILAEGDPAEMIAAYNNWAFSREKAKPLMNPSAALNRIGGTGRVTIERARLLDGSGVGTTGFYSGDALVLELDYVSELPPDTPVVLFIGTLRASDNQWVGEISTNHYIDPDQEGVLKKPVPLAPKGTLRITMDPLLLLNHHYHFWIMLYGETERYCEYRGVAPFFVARRAHVFDRDAVFWQPSRIENLSSKP